MTADLEIQESAVPPTRRSQRLGWIAGSVAVVMSLIGGFWLLDLTVPASDYEEVVTDLRATEVDLASTRAELEAFADEVGSLKARNAQLETELAASREVGPPGVEADPMLWHVEYEAARMRLFQARAARSAEFDLLRDSLCQWFTPEVMNDIVLMAQMESGTRFDVEKLGSADCAQQPGAGARWFVSRTGDGSDEFRFSIELRPVAADYRRLPNRMEPDDFVSPVMNWASRSPSATFDDPVSYGNLTYRSGNDDGVSVQLLIDGHEDEVLFFSLGVYDREAMMEPNPQWPSNRYEWFSYGVVNLMLEQMGWIECPTTWCR